MVSRIWTQCRVSIFREVMVEVRIANESGSPDFTLVHAQAGDVLFVSPGVLSTRAICQLGVLLESMRCPHWHAVRDERQAIAG